MLVDNSQSVFQDSFSEEVWTSTYKDHKDNNVTDMFRRVANHMASAEETEEKKAEWAEKFYDLLSNFRGVAGGRISANAGTEWGGTTLANCYVGPLPDYDLDSISGIYSVLVDQANTLKSEGGWGMDFSWIRPRGSFIKGVGVESPGSVRFMELFDKSSEIVTAGSGRKTTKKKAKGKIRKGAMMATLAVWHPDIVEFITAKQTAGRLSKFNMSVNCTDVFMERVLRIDELKRKLVDSDDLISIQKNWALQTEIDALETWDLMFPDTTHASYKSLWKGNIEDWLSRGLPVNVYETTTVSRLWNLIMESTYNRNEPGVLFLDRANKFLPFSYGESILSTNPCFTGDTETLTRQGYRRLDSLVGQKVEIWNGFEWSEVTPEVTAVNQRILDLEFSNGAALACTPYHTFHLRDGVKVQAKDLVVGNTLAAHSFPVINSGTEDPQAYTKGFYSGDGSVNHSQIWLYGDKTNLIDNLDVKTVSDQTVGATKRLLVCLNSGEWNKEYVPSVETSVSSRLDWLAGLFDSDGSVLKDGSVQVWSINKSFLINVQKLLNTLGTTGKVVLGKAATTKLMPDGNGGKKEYFCQDSWRLQISGFNVVKLREIGLQTHRLDLSYTPSRGAPHYPKVTKVSERATLEAKVYCFTEPKHHTGIFNSIYAGQCGEQTLAPGGVCCLGTLNLTQFITEDGTSFDLDALSKYTGYLVRFLDNVNTISATPLHAYTESMRHKRRIGCGVMGWGSALIMMGVRFGSERAGQLREQVMSTYARAAYMASIDLAEEKGKFTHCDPAKHAQGLFVQSLGLPKEYMEKLATVGIRNSSLLSQQPNGNGSILANIVTGGMEPVFMTEYIRTVIQAIVPDHLKEVTPNFHQGEFHETSFFKLTKEGDEDILRGVDEHGTVWKIDRNRGLTKEVLCEDYGVRYRKRKGIWDPNADYVVTTEGLTVKEHVEDLQGFARWTDSACSKTCNIPNDYPYEDFKTLYLDVYKTGYIKGFTTYRSGTMTSVLSAVKETEQTEQHEEEIILEEIKLPDSLPATLKTIKSEGRKWYLTVIMNDTHTRPVALFAQTNAHEKSVTTTDAVEHLEALARQKGIPAKYIEETLQKTAGDSNTTKICRMISLCLRHGVLIRNVVSALEKVDCIAGTFVFHIRKYLATMIKDGEKVTNETCQECGSTNVVYQEGCKVCANCGSSKCG